MRQKINHQMSFDWSDTSELKLIKSYRMKYERISEILDANPEIINLVHTDLKRLSTSHKKTGRKGDYTSDTILRALIVQRIEETSFRDAITRIGLNPFLKHFIRLGDQSVMDFTFLNKCFKAIQPKTWKKVNERLGHYAKKTTRMDTSVIRTDTTLVASHIHYPTDASLLWDSYRVLVRLLRGIKGDCPEIAHHRFHDKKAKKYYVYISRYAKTKSKKRKRQVRNQFKDLIQTVRRIVRIAQDVCQNHAGACDLFVMGAVAELAKYIPVVEIVISTAERANVFGEKVPAKDRVFSIFEPHVECINRGKKGKISEFGHMIWLTQNTTKFITDYDVMEQQIHDTDLTPVIVERHKDLFGEYPKTVAADRGFRAIDEVMDVLEEKVDTLAIPKRLKDWADSLLPQWERFRAGIEGSISVLKRAFRLATCYFRGFKSFDASVGLGIFCHNLVQLI
jgi:IS5 family transposase